MEEVHSQAFPYDREMVFALFGGQLLLARKEHPNIAHSRALLTRLFVREIGHKVNRFAT
jgi:hypothetical protein